MDKARIWVKDPQSTLAVGLHWEDVIERGDTLASAIWSVPDGLTKISEEINSAPMTDAGVIYAANEVALVKLSGGTVGMDYVITCEVTTGAGDIDQRSITVAVRDR